MHAWFGEVGRWTAIEIADVGIATWDRRLEHDGHGTLFVVAVEQCHVRVEHGAYPLPATAYAALPVAATVEGGCGLAVTARSHRGLFSVGGPIESSGRLKYIDGCSDTVLVPPSVRGDPCLNLLHLPPGVVQTDHDHPSLRVGVILEGAGRCVVADGSVEVLSPGVIFVLEAGSTHRFETGAQPLRLVAWHPDSDHGPTDDDHPMLNRTLRPGTSQRVR